MGKGVNNRKYHLLDKSYICRYPTDFWNTTTTDCTPDQLRESLDYAVSFVSYPTSPQPEAATFLGPSVNEFRSIFNATVALEIFIFDSFATIAKALDSYEKTYRSSCVENVSYCLENFNYGSREISDRLDRELLRTKQHLQGKQPEYQTNSSSSKQTFSSPWVV